MDAGSTEGRVVRMGVVEGRGDTVVTSVVIMCCLSRLAGE